MAFQRGIDGSQPLRPQPIAGQVGSHEEDRRAARSWSLGTGTLACPRCDAPVSLGGRPAGPADVLGCPFCRHVAAMRDFLSLAAPARPARVEVRLLRRRRRAGVR